MTVYVRQQPVLDFNYVWAEYGRNYGVQSVENAENAGCWWVFEAEAAVEKNKTKRLPPSVS